MGVDVKLLVVSEDEAHAEDVISRVANNFPQHLHIKASEVRQEIARLGPELVILQEPGGDLGLQLLHYISNELPDTLIIYLTEDRDPIKARDVNRSGAFDILFLPDEITALNDVLSRAVKAMSIQQKNKAKAAGGFTWGRGQVISFYSGRGGGGRSLIASTLAQTLQMDSNSSVLLVDLNLQYGGVETFLDVDHERSLFDLTPVLKELNDNHIRNVTAIEPKSHVEVLVSPRDAEVAERITEEHVQRLLRTARRYYDYILVDLSTDMNPVNYSALEEADRIFYVMTPDSPAIRTFGHVMKLFSKLSIDPTDRLEILLNRIHKDTELKEKDVKQHFNYPITAELREDAKRVQSAINRGVPLRSARKEKKSSPFVKDIQKLSSALLQQQSNRSAS
ncbi:AAA family ATPase [Kroppenstedtia eburnea]|uniref:Pilus assembly protein CpaE n=1 Tax=Kroppenstedtia eburnea TaxID=714067 RepID=A0A1N7MVN1_9BACL|nr:AAA family ATPase [Kroppenstedtia eburnea]QKI80685.1 AAA family ATPase [Kroppenstedtia eburnea]SIS90183.1 pilus assembly protein CpaE [Kroppenstedtia eburnea]